LCTHGPNRKENCLDLEEHNLDTQHTWSSNKPCWHLLQWDENCLVLRASLGRLLCICICALYHLVISSSRLTETILLLVSSLEKKRAGRTDWLLLCSFIVPQTPPRQEIPVNPLDSSGTPLMSYCKSLLNLWCWYWKTSRCTPS